MISLKLMKNEIIKLIVRPNSKVTDVCGVYLNRIKVKLAAPPEKGKANRELIKFISGRTGVPKKLIKIISGERSNHKEVSIRSEKDFDLISKLITG